MDIWILEPIRANKELQELPAYHRVGCVGVYKSLMWVDRYREPGEFELIVPYFDAWQDLFKYGRIVARDGTNHAMLILKMVVDRDADGQTVITVSGRSLEIVLDWRIENGVDKDGPTNGSEHHTGNFLAHMNFAVKAAFGVTGQLPDVFKHKPWIPGRQVGKIEILDNYEDTRFADMNIDYTTSPDTNLGEWIRKMCDEKSIGYELVLNSNWDGLKFKFYKGIDRSATKTDYTNVTDRAVILSPSLGNLSEIRTGTDYTDYLSFCFYKFIIDWTNYPGDWGEMTYSGMYRVMDGDQEKYTGLFRRESYYLGETVTYGDDYSAPNEYDRYDQVSNSSHEKIRETWGVYAVDGKAVDDGVYRPNVDYFLGDLVTVYDGLGSSSLGVTCEITEMVYSDNDEGAFLYPTFSTPKNQKYDSNGNMKL